MKDTAEIRTVTINDIQTAAQHVSIGRDRLGEAARAYHRELTELHDAHRPGLKVRVETLRSSYDSLIELIEAAPDLFIRPKSIESWGLKIGFRKGKGSVQFADGEKLARRLRDLQGKRVISKATVEGIVTVKVKVSKAALAKLDGNILKRLGVDVVAGQDEPFAQPLDSEVDKLVKLLFAQEDDEGER